MADRMRVTSLIGGTRQGLGFPLLCPEYTRRRAGSPGSERGGDPASVKLCYKTGLNYVSCSPYRVPIARLAAAQAALGK